MSKNESICRKCFHSYVCEQFNEHRDDDNQKCHFNNDHFVSSEDVVKVVRCKDCKHKVDALGRTMCSRTAVKKGNGWFGLTAKEENHFCSYGELKECEGK